MIWYIIKWLILGWVKTFVFLFAFGLVGVGVYSLIQFSNWLAYFWVGILLVITVPYMWSAFVSLFESTESSNGSTSARAFH